MGKVLPASICIYQRTGAAQICFVHIFIQRWVRKNVKGCEEQKTENMRVETFLFHWKGQGGSQPSDRSYSRQCCLISHFRFFSCIISTPIFSHFHDFLFEKVLTYIQGMQYQRGGRSRERVLTAMKKKRNKKCFPIKN